MQIYKIMMILSTIVRQCYLPNPFENCKNGFLYNLMAEPIMHMITYGIVGMFYEGGAPVIGSFLYLLFYAIHTGLLMLMGYFNWNKIAIAIILAIYGFIICCISRHKDI